MQLFVRRVERRVECFNSEIMEWKIISELKHSIESRNAETFVICVILKNKSEIKNLRFKSNQFNQIFNIEFKIFPRFF